MKIRITKKGLPKAQWMISQPGVELKPLANQQPNYAWMTFNTNPFVAPQQSSEPPKIDLSAFMPPRIVREEDITEDMRPPQEPVQTQTQGINPSALGIGPRMTETEREIQAKYDSDPKFARTYDENLGYGVLTSYLQPNSRTSRKELRNYVDFFNKKYDTDLKMPLANPKLAQAAKAVSTGIGALALAGNVVDYFEADKKKKEWERFFRQRMMEQAPSTEFEGIENINTGRMFENMLPKPNQGRFEDGGENIQEPMKIRITSAPKMAYGGQANYGLDLGRKKIYTDMPEEFSSSISSVMGAVPRAAANIEAEGGETVYGDIDGDGALEHMKISGPRHSEGGVPLNVPEGSFIFSDTKKMMIKDPAVLAMFGKTVGTKKGYTPAQLAKQYDINKFKAIAEDPDADELSKSTAQLMLTNYRKKLSDLAIIQEEMKGFPQGLPQVAEGSTNTEAIAKFGGYLPKFQNAGTYIPEWARILPLNPTAPAQAQSTQTAPVVVDETKSPKQLAAMSDPEYQKFMDLLNKYDTRTVSGYKYVNAISDADAKEFARLATKFGFTRTNDKNEPVYRVMQGSTPGYVFKTGAKNKKAGFFGGYKPEMYERRVVEDVLGADAVKDMSDVDVRKAYFKELGVDVSNLTDDQLKNAKSLYTNKNFFEKQFYPQFIKRFGKDDYRTLLGDDMMIGAEHYDSYRSKQKPVTTDTTVYGFICKGIDANGSPIIEESAYRDAQAFAASGAFSSRQEASLACKGDIPPGRIIPPGKKKEIPPKYLTPDTMALMTAMAYPPKMYLPYVSDIQFRPGQLALEDWLSQAQNVQQTYNTSANTLGNYQPGTALASNLSFLAGQAGDQVSQAISQVGSRNVDRFNQFAANETQRKQAIDSYNAAARDKRWDGYTIAKQNLDNARRRYLTNVTKAFNNRWANRMYTDMVNKVNPIYNLDPVSGLSYFKEGYDWSKFTPTGSGGMGGYSGFPAAKRELMKLGMSEANAEKEALASMRGGRTSYSDTDGDGYPNTTRMTTQGQPNLAAAQQLLPLYLGLMQSGASAYPWSE